MLVELVLRVVNFVKSLGREEGQDTTEYAILVGLIALAVIAGAGLLGGNLDQLYNDIAVFVAGLAPA